VGGYAPGALEDSVRPRRSMGASGRPLNFTVRALWASTAVVTDHPSLGEHMYQGTLLAIFALAGLGGPAQGQAPVTIFHAVLGESGQRTGEVSTEELNRILAREERCGV
jgi:hypothetical protein